MENLDKFHPFSARNFVRIKLQKHSALKAMSLLLPWCGLAGKYIEEI
jgi:hypothetical protein